MIIFRAHPPYQKYRHTNYQDFRSIFGWVLVLFLVRLLWRTSGRGTLHCYYMIYGYMKVQGDNLYKFIALMWVSTCLGLALGHIAYLFVHQYRGYRRLGISSRKIESNQSTKSNYISSIFGATALLCIFSSQHYACHWAPDCIFQCLSDG